MAVIENDLIVGPVVLAAGVRVISLDFYFEKREWLKVYRSGSETPLALGSAYTVSGEGTGSGAITLTSAANGTDSYAVYLVVPLERSSDMQLRGEFRSGPFNLELDRIWQRLQLHATELARAFRLGKTAKGTTSITPTPSRVLGFDDAGGITTYSLNPITTGPATLLYDTVQSFQASLEGPRGIGSVWLVGPFQFIELSPAADSNTYAIRNQGDVKLQAVPIMGMYSVEQWGVLPNDADQHWKIERCIYNVWTRGGGTICFSAGTYLTSKPIRVKSGVVLDGGPPTQFDGDSSVTIQAMANFVGAAVVDIDNRTVEQGADQSPPALIPEVTVPDAPTSLSAAPSQGQVGLTWVAPVDNGGAAISGYQIERNIAGGGWAVLGTVGNVLTYTDTGLTAGTSYAYRVSAVNAEGIGPASAQATAIPFTIPSAPQNLAAVGGDETAALTWEAPASDGFTPITGYLIERNSGGAGWSALATVGVVLNYTDLGAVPGVANEYRVSAINAAGTGPTSNVATASAGTVPTAPQNLAASPGDESVTLTWQAPADDGGLPITGYRIERNAAGAGWVTYDTVGVVLTYLDLGALNGVTYEYRVSAINAQGAGPSSNVVSAIPAATVSEVTALTIAEPDFADYPMVVEKADLTVANVPVSGTFIGTAPTSMEFRIVTDLGAEVLTWTALAVTTSGSDWSGSVAMTSGTGRYLAQVRSSGVSAAQTVPFRTAGLVTMYGQSNALLFNDAQTSGITPNAAAFSFDSHQDYGYGPPRGDGSVKLLNDLIAETGISWTIVVGGQGGSLIADLAAGTTAANNFLAELGKIAKKPFYYLFHQGEGDAPTAGGRAYSSYRDPFRSIVDAVNALYPDETGQTMDVLIQSLGTFLQDPPQQNVGWAAVDGWHKQLVADFADTHWAGSWRDMRHITGVELDPYHGTGEDYERRAVRAFETIKALRGITPAFETFRIDTATRIDATTTDVTVIHGQGNNMSIAGIVFGQEALDPNITEATGFEISDGAGFQQAAGVITGPNTIRWTHPAIATFGCTYRYLYGQTIPAPVGVIVDNSSATVPLLHEEVPKPVIDGAGPTGATFAQQAFTESASGPNHTFTPTLTLPGATRFLYTVQILQDRNMTMTVNGVAATLLGSYISPNSDGNGNPTGNVNELFVFETDQVGEVSISVSGGSYPASSYEFTITEAAGVTGAWSVADAVFRMPASSSDNTIVHATLDIPAGDVVSGVAIGRANPGDLSQYVSINFESYSGAFGSAQAIVATGISAGGPVTYQIVLTNNLIRMGSMIATISAA